MIKIIKNISYVILLVAIAAVFRKFFFSGPLVSGDAPFFYKEGLKELVNFPTVWTSRGNSLGGVNLFLWIYPLMVIYGILGTVLNLNNDIIIRILFYFPSLLAGICGVWFLTKYLKFSKTVQFFATLIYLMNTYYLLLIDGGQVGVVLAYGLFPLVLTFLTKLINKNSISNFLTALISSFILTIVDFRIAAICVFTVVILNITTPKKLRVLFLVALSLLGLSSYWIIPAFKLSASGVTTGISGLQTTSLLNTLFLFSPNWPANEFGKTIAPYFYFMFVPILVFIPLFITREKKIVWLTFCFLLFAFLVKGESAPFGFLYTVFINTKVGSVFRDSTKFFIPLILIAGILVGSTVEMINKKFLGILVFIHFLLLVGPAFAGQLNGVLGKNPNLSDYQKIYKLISNDSGSFRSAWFNEKSPFAYHTQVKQALDAKDLVSFRPFASMNVGTGDHFNFINNKEYLDWFSLLGIKYLILNGNPRVLKLNESDQKDWNRLGALVGADNRLQKLDIGTSFSFYKNPNILPNKFFVDKSFVVFGGDDIYHNFFEMDKNFSVSNQGFIFPEDGKFDLANMQNVASTSAIIIFNKGSKTDLKMSLLQKDFIKPISSYYSQWALRTSEDFLGYKYELLQKNIAIHDFDYNQGIAFSNQPNEELKFNINIPSNGDYFLEIRSMNATGSGNLKVNFNQQSDFVKRSKANNFEWFEKGPISLKAANYSLNLQNTTGTQVVNTVALISSGDMKFANQLADKYLKTFTSYDLSKLDDQQKIKQILQNDKWENLVDGQVTRPGWIIFTDSYNPDWMLYKTSEDSTPSFPFYSMINGFYADPKWGEVKIQFKGEEDLRWGIYLSVLSALIIILIVLWKKSEK